MVWTWDGERRFDQSNWKVDLPFPKMKRSKLGVGRWEVGTLLAIPGETAGRRWKSESAFSWRGLGQTRLGSSI